MDNKSQNISNAETKHSNPLSPPFSLTELMAELSKSDSLPEVREEDLTVSKYRQYLLAHGSTLNSNRIRDKLNQKVSSGEFRKFPARDSEGNRVFVYEPITK